MPQPSHTSSLKPSRSTRVPTPTSLGASTRSTVFDPNLAALAGSHRVQRVPASEKGGRRHTSEVSVVVFDGDTAAHSRLDRRDVRVDTFKASGAGGQHRNKTDSAVRLTHIPTGTAVTATEQRSQHQNRQVAWQRLERALCDQALEAGHAAENNVRRNQRADYRSWTWTQWRDEVKGPAGNRSSMKRALTGRLGPLLRVVLVS